MSLSINGTVLSSVSINRKVLDSMQLNRVTVFSGSFKIDYAHLAFFVARQEHLVALSLFDYFL